MGLTQRDGRARRQVLATGLVLGYLAAGGATLALGDYRRATSQIQAAWLEPNSHLENAGSSM